MHYDKVGNDMQKCVLSKAHLQKRAQKKRFVLRLDVFGTFLQREMNTEDYFSFTSQFPDEADKVILDAMYSGDWYSVYPSEVLPLRHNVFLDKWRSSGIDIFEEWVRIIKKERKKECWLSHRIAEVDLEKDKNAGCTFITDLNTKGRKPYLFGTSDENFKP